MAVLDFPPAPTTGQKYPVTPIAGQPQYTWDGEKWTTVGAQIVNAPPATVAPLMDAAVAAVGSGTRYAREDHVHPRISAAPMDALAYSGMQVNGSTDISQERLATSLSIPYGAAPVVLDNWGISNVTNGATVAAQQVTDAPVGLTKSLKITVTTPKVSLIAADTVNLYTAVEGYRAARLGFGKAGAQPVTVGFWVKTKRVGLYSGALQNGAVNRGYVFTFTMSASDTWEYKTVTIPGDTTGTWPVDNTVSMYLTLTMAAGSNYTTTPGAWAANNRSAATGIVNGITAVTDTYQVTGVVILPGSEAPPAARAPFIMRPADQELLLCQRYYYKSYWPWSLPGANNDSGYIVMSVASGGTAIWGNAPFAVPMRAVPTLKLWSIDGTPNRWSAISGVLEAGTGSLTPTATWGIVRGANSVAVVSDYLVIGHFTADARLV